MKRPIAHCDRCRRWCYCLTVHFRDERGQIFRHTWLCRPCSTLIGVQEARSNTPASAWMLSEALMNQIATALVEVSHTAVLANPDGTITCIWITPDTEYRQPGEE